MADKNLNIAIRARDHASQKFGLLGRSLDGLKGKMLALGAAAGAYLGGRALISGFTGAVQEAETFKKQMASVNTMLGAGQEQYLAQYEKQLLSMSVKFGESTATLSDGLYNILSASVPAEHAMSVLAVASKAATGGMTTTAVAVDGLTSLMNAYGVEATQAASVSDLMFATVKAGKLNFEQLANNIGKVAPMARAANMSMGNMMAMISTLTRQGLSTEEATTRIGAILKSLPASGKNLLGVVQQFQGKSLEEILKLVPESRAASGLAALAADIQGLQRDMAGMANSTGAAAEAFEKMSATKRFDRLGAAWAKAKIEMGGLIGESETFGKIMDGLTKTLGNVGNYWDIMASSAKLALVSTWEDAKFLFSEQLPAALSAMTADFQLAFGDRVPSVMEQMFFFFGDVLDNLGENVKTFFSNLWDNIKGAYESFQRGMAFSLAKIMIEYDPRMNAAEKASALESLQENKQQADKGKGFEWKPLTEGMKPVLEGTKFGEAWKKVPKRMATETEKALAQSIADARKRVAGMPDIKGAAGATQKPAGQQNPAAAQAAATATALGLKQGGPQAAFQARFLTNAPDSQTPAWAKELAALAKAQKEQDKIGTEALLSNLPKDIAKNLGAVFGVGVV